MVPDDAIGINAFYNDDPTGEVQTAAIANITPIVSRTNNTIVFRQPDIHAHTLPTYLGTIVSHDRQIIYWVNNTRPLP